MELSRTPREHERPLRIVHIVPDLTMGGAERMLERLLAAHSTSRSFSHEVISLRSKGTVGPMLAKNGVAVSALGIRTPLDAVRSLVNLAKRFRRCTPDIVHCWMYHGNLIGGLAAKLAGVRGTIWAIRNTDVGRRAGTARTTIVLRRLAAVLSSFVPDAIVYVALSARRSHEEVGFAPSKGVIIPNGYPPAPSRKRDQARSDLGVAENDLLIGSVGRFNHSKAPEIFVKAAALVAERNTAAKFVMAGRDCDAANRELNNWIAREGLTERFLLLGERSDIHRIFAAMDIFCLHSRSEAFPNVLAEAMNAGIACVATDVGDSSAVLGGHGRLVAAGDVPAIASALLGLAALTAAARTALGRRSSESIRARFSMESTVHDYEKLYSQLNGRLGYPQLGEQ